MQNITSIKKLSDDHLHENTLAATSREKLATLDLLEFLSEVDSRRLYNARGYSTLWEYTHKALGYSEAQASERISAMRLMREIPEVKVKLSENKLTLTSAAKLASFVRRESCTPSQTLELLDRVSHKSSREVERILISEQTLPVTRPDVMKPTGEKSTHISFDADPEFLELFNELKNLQGNSGWSMNDRLKEAMKTLLKKKKSKFIQKDRENPRSTSPCVVKPERSAHLLRAHEAVGCHKNKKTPSNPPSLMTRPTQGSRYIPASVRRTTSERSGGQCEYVDKKTNQRCESRFALQLDHRLPFAKGGRSSSENIRHLCANHNRFEAIREYGAKKMEPTRFEESNSRAHKMIYLPSIH